MSAQVVVIVQGATVEAADATIGPDRTLHLVGGKAGDAGRSFPPGQVLAVFFQTLPSDAPARAWLCLRDGQRLSGPSLTMDGERAVLKQLAGEPLTASTAETAAVFFHAARPALASQPADGVRIVSTNGDVLNAPALEWGEAGLLVEVNPNVDPISLPRDRIAAILWADAPAATSPTPAPSGGFTRAATTWVELRTGERVGGAIESLDRQGLKLRTSSGSAVFARREVEAIWFARPRTQAVEQLVPAPTTVGERPAFRRDRNAMGGVLRMDGRLFDRGIGMRGPATFEIPVPVGATFMTGLVGPDADAAPQARVTVTIEVDGKARAEYADMAPGEPARRTIIPVSGAARVRLSLRGAGADTAGCLGDMADAFFVY